MKQETNNEIDLLLRRLSRRQDTSMPAADHLDTDELSSYAENALPAAARSRYTAHLAECSTCRELVVQLSSSAGFVGAEESSRVREPSGLKKFLASLFSPMVLRYAVPALGFIIVAAIGFAVFRTNRGTDFVAQRENAPTTEAKPQSPPPAVVDNQQQPGIATPEHRTDQSKQTPAGPAPEAPPAVSNTAAAKQEEQLQKEQQPVAIAAPSQPAPKPAAATDEIRTVQSEAPAPQRRKAEANEVARERTDDAKKGEESRSEDVAAARATPAKTRAQDSRVAPGAGIGRLQRDGFEDKDDAETRTVAGRRFRKQGGIWIDTAYTGHGAMVNVTRGSEQYRALVADEPAIRTIAEQLDGQIVVVWKGRTYKIR
jgi:cell division protein FtsN